MVIKREELVCDVCGTKLYKRDVLKNDGSYQKDFISHDGKDVCFSCAGKILDIFLMDVIKDEFSNYVNEMPKKLNPLSMYMQPIDFGNISFNVKE